MWEWETSMHAYVCEREWGEFVLEIDKYKLRKSYFNAQRRQ